MPSMRLGGSLELKSILALAMAASTCIKATLRQFMTGHPLAHRYGCTTKHLRIQ